ncbi:GbsR/MarR family transcriptional regulator [Rhodobacter lacus]|uniref:HTH-type transcriptional regulator n=1 Tax=Rhodobacter lacus TaxID=1641972 RepID=A0ABW5A5R2_9RHOB
MTTTPPAAEVTALFSDLATRFGFSRAAGACLGTIWRAAQAPSAEDLCTALGLSRSNVSVALKELRQAGLVQVARAPGTRRDFYVADPDPWALLRAALADRHRREIAPLTARLASLAAQPEPDPRIVALATMSGAAEDWMMRLTRRDSADFAQILGQDRAEKKKKKHAREK